MPKEMGILDGVYDCIDLRLGLTDQKRYTKKGKDPNNNRPRYSVKTAAKDLSGEEAASRVPGDPNLLVELLAIIRGNWKSGGCNYRGQRANWVLDKSLPVNPGNDTDEVVLERLIVLLLEKDWAKQKLFNQIATCSGLMPVKNDGMHVDLILDHGKDEYEFIELKYHDGSRGTSGSDNPLYAAFEVIIYGLLFRHAKDHPQKLLGESRLKDAKKIQLTVLAPSGFYRFKRRGGTVRDYDFAWLEARLNKWLKSIASDCQMVFRFHRFTEGFEKSYGVVHNRALPKAIQSFCMIGLEGRESVYARR